MPPVIPLFSVDLPTILEASPDALVIINSAGHIVYINQQTERLFNVTREEIIGQMVEELLPVRYRQQHQFHRQKYFESLRIRPMGAGHDLYGVKKGGSEFPIEISLSPLQTDIGVLALAAIRDITERKKAEMKFKAFVETMPDALVIINKTGNIVLVNTQTEKLFNFNRSELLDKPIENLIPLRYRDKHIIHRTRYFDNPRTRPMAMGMDLYGIKKEGAEFPVEISLAPLEAEEGSLVLAAIRDVTERKSVEKILQDKERELKERQMQATFLANMGHEFRTPLTLMLNPLEDALTDKAQPLTEVQFNRINMVRENALRLLKMVNSLLDFSKIESGYLQPCYEATDIVQYTTDLISVFHSALEKAGVALKLDMGIIKEPVYLDKDLWEKIIFNLLSNALKFTPDGSITVSIKKHIEGIKIEIIDTGIGIPAKELPHMFERFHRVESNHNRYQGGTGIGLAFTKELVKAHGGSITVTSVEGQGSTFTLFIPLGCQHLPAERIITPGVPISKEEYIPKLIKNTVSGWLPAHYKQEEEQPILSATSPETTLPESSTSSMKKEVILFVDDDSVLCRYTRQLLSPFWEVHTATNGEEALEKIHSIHPALILSDIMMPKMDGIALLKTLRNNPTTQFIPIILLSARDDSVVEGLQLGAEDYLVKPFKVKELLARVRTHLELGLLRKQLEERVKQRTADLVQINETLRVEIEERLKVERALITQTMHMKLADEHRRKQEEFIDTLCHEVRNPLTGVYGSLFSLRHTLTELETQFTAVTHLLEENILNKFNQELINAKGQLEVIEECTQYQKEFMDDVLDLSKLENKKLIINPVPFELKQLMQRIAKIFQAQLEQKQLTLELKLPENETYLNADTHLLSRILSNLLSNAIKFTETGTIIIIGKVDSLSANECILHISIKDTGIGMSAEEVKHLFDRFMQANRRTASKYGGSGLGLVISKQFVEMMGGHIEVVSKKDQGTEFSFTIKCQLVSAKEKMAAKTSTAPAISLSAYPLQNKKILVVEDNEINQRVLVQMLTKSGAICQVANDGAEALKAYTQERFDLILMDIEMPNMNGLEATQAIRSKEKQLGYRTPIIALSGYTREERIKTALHAGMDDYLTKPYENTTMLSLIQSHLAKNIPSSSHLSTGNRLTSSATLVQFEQFRRRREEGPSARLAETPVIHLPRANSLTRNCCF